MNCDMCGKPKMRPTPNAADSWIPITTGEAQERQLRRGDPNGSIRYRSGSLAKDVAAGRTVCECSRSAAYSPESEGLILALNEPGTCELCGSASRTLTASGSSPGIGLGSRSTGTCAPLWRTPGAYEAQQRPSVNTTRRRMEIGKTLSLSAQVQATAAGIAEACPCRCHTSTSSPADSPAKTSPTPAAAPGSPGNARAFGPSTPVSFANYDPDTCLWKTCQLSLLEEWAEYSGTWPRWGTAQNGVAYALPMSELPTDATESGSWGTPTARDYKDTGDMTNVPENGLLGRQVLNRTRPTPTKSDGSGGPGSSGRDGGENLRTAAVGALNPEFVEWLMGFPPGWTKVE